MTVEREDIFIITLLCHTRRWTAYTGTQKELFQANPPFPECYHHSSFFIFFFFSQNNSFLIFQRICRFFLCYSIAGTVFSDHPCIKQSLELVFVGCQSPQFVSPLITIIFTFIKRLPLLSGRNQQSPNGLFVLPSTCFNSHL